MNTPYDTPIALLEQRRAQLTEGNWSIPAEEESLANLREEVEQKAALVADLKAELVEVDHALVILKAGH